MAYPDFEDTQSGAVAAHNVWAEAGREVTPSDVMNALRDLNRRFETFERELGSHREAFTLNDLGKPDFHNHRSHHKQIDENSKLMKSYKNDVTKQILTAIIGVLIGVFATGFKDTFFGSPTATKAKPALSSPAEK